MRRYQLGIQVQLVWVTSLRSVYYYPSGYALGLVVSSVLTTATKRDSRYMGWVAFGSGVNPLENSADGSCPLPKAKPSF